MKSFQVVAAFVAVAAAQVAVPQQIQGIVQFLPTSIIAAHTNVAKDEPAAWATLQAKMHSVVAANEAFFQTYSGAVPGFGGLSALVATAYDTALLTGGASQTSTSSSSSSSTTSSSSSSETSSSSSSTSSSTSVPGPVLVSSGTGFSSSSMATSTVPTNVTFTSPTPTATSSQSSFNAAPTNLAFGIYGVAVAGAAGLAALL